MNCREGDLAVIVRCDPMPDCVGRVVECVAMERRYQINGAFYDNVWRVRWGDNNASELTGYEDWGCPDAWMRPIRDSDGEDEMLRIAGKPQEVNA